MTINVNNSTNRVIITAPKLPDRIIISGKGTQGATGAFFRVVDTATDLIPSFGNDRDTAITIIDGFEYRKSSGAWAATGRRFWGTLLPDTTEQKRLSEVARDKAEQWASNPVDVAVEPNEYSAKHYAAKSAIVLNNLNGGTKFQALIKLSDADYDYAWVTLTGMQTLIYDPRAVAADVFDMANMTEGANALILRAAERTKIAASTGNTGTVTSVAVAVPAGFSVSGAITTSGTITISHASGYQGYTTAEANKLSGIDLSLYQTRSQKDAVNGYAGLDGSGKLSAAQLPSIAITDTFVVATQAAMLALTVQVGDIAVRTDVNKTFIVQAEPATTLANWVELRTPTDAVQSVIGLTGPITQAELRTALGLGTAAYVATGDFATPASVALKITKAGDTGLIGFTGVAYVAGSLAGTTKTLNPMNGNFQSLANNGAGTIAAPVDNDKSFTMVISVWPDTGAGAITMTGFNKVIGTYSTSKYWFLNIVVVGNIKIATWLEVA